MSLLLVLIQIHTKVPDVLIKTRQAEIHLPPGCLSYDTAPDQRTPVLRIVSGLLHLLKYFLSFPVLKHDLQDRLLPLCQLFPDFLIGLTEKDFIKIIDQILQRIRFLFIEVKTAKNLIGISIAFCKLCEPSGFLRLNAKDLSSDKQPMYGVGLWQRKDHIPESLLPPAPLRGNIPKYLTILPSCRFL